MLEIYDLSEHLFNLFFETILLASQKVLITAPRSMENFDEIAGNGYPLHEWQSSFLFSGQLCKVHWPKSAMHLVKRPPIVQPNHSLRLLLALNDHFFHQLDVQYINLLFHLLW